MMDFVREYKEYVITAAIGLLASVLIALGRGLLEAESLDVVMMLLSDACFVPGMVLVCIGLLLLAVNEGLFDGVAYGFKVIGRTITAKKEEKLVQEEYHEYHARMRQKRIGNKHFLLVGAAFVVVSVIFVVIYMFAA